MDFKWYDLLAPIISPAIRTQIEINKAKKSGDYSYFGSDVPDPNPGGSSSFFSKIGSGISTGISNFGKFLKGLWKDFTGISAVELENKLERERAEENYQRNLESIEDTKAAYEASGLNPNLMYGANPVQYEAPHLQEYSGSRKLDTILSRVGKVLSSIPMLYQATAALEGIDQARERTKQSEIKTMSMGLSLLDQGYKTGDLALSHPFTTALYPSRFGGKRHVKELDRSTLGLSIEGFDNSVFSRYADSSLKNKFDLLESIGIKNRMNSTLNNWRGYQYSLDQKYGEAGKIIGLGTSLMGGISKLYPYRFK